MEIKSKKLYLAGQIGNVQEGVVEWGIDMGNAENIFTIGDLWAEKNHLFVLFVRVKIFQQHYALTFSGMRWSTHPALLAISLVLVAGHIGGNMHPFATCVPFLWGWCEYFPRQWEPQQRFLTQSLSHWECVRQPRGIDLHILAPLLFNPSLKVAHLVTQCPHPMIAAITSCHSW